MSNDRTINAKDDWNDHRWTTVIGGNSSWWNLPLREIWQYRDLILLFVHRDFVSVYKQTVLGPLWFVIQPIFTTIVFTIIFSRVAGIPTDGHPAILFYLAGTVPWNYFAACLTKTSNTFVANAGIFGKVYFPRLVVPISIVLSNITQFIIQFLLFVGCLGVYLAIDESLDTQWSLVCLLTPLLVALMAALGLGVGILVSSMTTKYRDLVFLMNFGIQLAMYATPIIYPLSAVSDRWRFWMMWNPMAAPIEAFRAIYLGGIVPWQGLAISTAITGVVLVAGLVLFHRVEKTFMDTV